MDIEEIRQDYWIKSSKLLTALYHAGKRVVEAMPDKDLRVEVNGFGSDGSVVGGSFVLVTSTLATTFWQLIVGFEPAQGLGLPEKFDNAIDYDVPTGRPPYRLPVSAYFRGRDRFRRPDERSIKLPSIVVTGSAVEWDHRRWDRVEDVDAEWIMRRLVNDWLLHPSPEAASRAARDGRWRRLEEHPKRGGQAEVWKVSDGEVVEGPLYAKKQMRYPKPRTSKQYRRFIKEIKVVAELQHPHIVRVIDYHIPDDDDGSEPFYVMPWANATLRQAKDLKGNVLRVLEIGLAVADALCAALEHGVIHRDVKPENVLLLGDDRTAALADFGICFLQATDDGERLTRILEETVGSDDYVAPELRGGRLDEVDSRVDVYSLGKTLYAVLAAGPPFPLERWDDARYDLRADGNPALDHFYGLLPRMVATNPDDRFESIVACRDQLRRAVEAVRGFVSYQERMYAGPATPGEILSRLQMLLRTTESVQRRDRIRQTVDDAIAAAREAAGKSSGLGSPSLDQQRAAAEQAAGFLLAAAFPLLEGDDWREFPRIVAELDAAFSEGHRSKASDPVDAIRRAAAAVALYGIAAAAWHLRRLRFLRSMMDVYAVHPHGPIYLDLAEGHATKSWGWVSEMLARSDATRGVRRLHEDLSRTLHVSAGMLALAYAFGRSPGERATVFQDELADIDFPAVLFPDWTATLADALRRDPILETEVATQLFGFTDAQELRRVAREVTTSLTDAIARARSPLVSGSRRSLSGPWEHWCGASGRRSD